MSKVDDGVSTPAVYFSLVVFIESFQALTSVQNLSSVLCEDFQNAHLSLRIKKSSACRV